MLIISIMMVFVFQADSHHCSEQSLVPDICGINKLQHLNFDVKDLVILFVQQVMCKFLDCK